MTRILWLAAIFACGYITAGSIGLGLLALLACCAVRLFVLAVEDLNAFANAGRVP